MARKRKRRIIKHSSGIKATRDFVRKLVKKTRLAKYVKKMGFHTNPSKER